MEDYMIEACRLLKEVVESEEVVILITKRFKISLMRLVITIW